MRKLVLVLGIVFSVLLSGCVIQDAFKDEPELTSLTGILFEQTITDDVSGTHLLTVTDAGEQTEMPLRSLSVNLSGQNYLENRVQVIGFMNEDDGVFEVTGISVVEALHEIVKDPEFIGYKNTDFGIQLEYYNNWDVNESDDSIVFTAPVDDDTELGGDEVVISQIPFMYQPTISEDGEEDNPLLVYMSENFPEVNDPDSLIHKIGLASLDAVEMEDGMDIVYYVYRSGFVYEISFVASENHDHDNMKLFAEMLAEFKFTGFTVEGETEDDAVLDEEGGEDEESTDIEEPVEEANDVVLPVLDMKFATFESLPLLFAGEYPASWYYAGSSGSSADILRHYGFSDESVEDDNELISLDVITSDIPSGSKLGNLTVVESGNTYTAYATVNERNYRVEGDKEYKDIILHIAGSIIAIED